jgi:hypothetical protein
MYVGVRVFFTRSLEIENVLLELGAMSWLCQGAPKKKKKKATHLPNYLF